MTGFGDLIDLAEPRVLAFLVALARLAGLFALAPFFGARIAPVRVRAALAFFMALVMLPAVGDGPILAMLDGVGPIALTGIVILEVGVGFTIGLVSQFVFSGVQMAGQLAGIQMGLGLSNLVDPQTQEQITSLAQWQNLVALLVFLAMDAHHLLIEAVAHSFVLVPPGLGLPGPEGFGIVLAMAGSIFVIALRIAAPVMVLLLFTNAAMGVLAKVVPQLNVFIVGFPLNVAAGLFMLMASQPFTIHYLMNNFSGLGPSLANVLRAFG